MRQKLYQHIIDRQFYIQNVLSYVEIFVILEFW